MTKSKIASTFTDIDFVASWVLNNNLETISANALALKFGDNPFLGLLEKDQIPFKEFIQSSPAGHGIYLPWINQVDHKSFWLKWNVKHRDDHFFLFAVDVTDVKSNELYLEQILDSITDMILVKGEGSKIEWANKAFQEYYNLSNEQLKEMIDADYVSADYTQQYIVDDKKVWDTGDRLLIECEPVVRFDGVERKFQTSKTPIFGPNNKINFTVGISRDITEKIENQEKTMMASKMGAIGEMAGGMAHEINNPVAVIAGKSYILRRVLKKEGEITKAMILEYLDTVDVHVDRITKVLKTLRRLSVNDDFEGFSQVDISKLIQDTLLLCESKIRELGIAIKLDIPNGVMVDARVVQLSQALLYLITNAADAAETAKVKWIKIKVQIDGAMIAILVSDSGAGVPDEILGKIFQPFFTTKEIGKGTGLGLSFSLSVAKNHGGDLRVVKEICPSCFLLEFPIKHIA